MGATTNTAKQLLWLPTSREEKYKAKQAVDSCFAEAPPPLEPVRAETPITAAWSSDQALART